MDGEEPQKRGSSLLFILVVIVLALVVFLFYRNYGEEEQAPEVMDEQVQETEELDFTIPGRPGMDDEEPKYQF